MADDSIVVFPAGSMAKGIEIRTINFDPEVAFDWDTYNVTHGILVGSGPRYSFSTIPGQADNETIGGTRYPGLRAAEGAPAQGMQGRLKVLAVLPISLGTNTTPSTKINAYLWIITRGTTETIDMCVSSTTADISALIYDGMAQASDAVSSTLYTTNFFAEAIPTQGGARGTTLGNAIAYTSGKFYASAAILSVSGADVPMQWYFGNENTTGDANHAPNLGLQQATQLKGPSGATITSNLGVPSFFNLQNYPLKERFFNIYTVTNTGGFNTQYFLRVNPTSTIFVKDVLGANNTVLNIDAIAVSSTPVAGVPANTKGALVEDSAGVHNTSYKAALVAAKKPFACIFQDSYSASTHHKQQWVDLTANSYQPPLLNSNTYIEEGVRKQSCFEIWPDFIRGTAMIAYGAGGTTALVTLGGANTGILRQNTVYEFTYSIYNKRLNFETNVGAPVKFQVGATDNASLNLFTLAGNPAVGQTNVYSCDQLNAGLKILPFIFSDYTDSVGFVGQLNYMNFTQYRFYYRQEGTFEWLPALFIDAPKYWFFRSDTIRACTGAIAALPGGQPGAFNDYSTLPQDTYDCVVNYKDRAWWFSEKAINFSLRNNVFAYPGRNSINAAGGSFRGGIVHNYPGQAEQSSRLVIFGSDTTYVARFSGLPQQTQVQVSADTSGTFNIDGSDLVIDPWTSVTAFSYRAAVVADGILYWWGPQGIYRDDGVNTPTKISGDQLEPTIFSIYDPNKIDEIHAYYDEHTKDITWFYVPKTADDYATHSIVYNTTSREFLRGKFIGKVDWVSNLNVQSNIGTAGKRGLAGVRASGSATIQRAFFYDLRNRAGDIRPTTDFVVKQISTPSTGLRRLTLAAGYDATNFATIAIGDIISLQQLLEYTGTAGSDMVATVAAVGAGTIDITLPTGATLTNATPTFDQYFPLWQKTAAGAGLNGLTWKITTFYWAVTGLNAYWYWLYTYFLFNCTKWKTDSALAIDFTYRNATAPAAASDTVTLFAAGAEPNSDGHAQVYKRMTIGEDAAQGQAILYTLGGIHIGHEWVLQLLDAHNRPIDIEPLFPFMS